MFNFINIQFIKECYTKFSFLRILIFLPRGFLKNRADHSWRYNLKLEDKPQWIEKNVINKYANIIVVNIYQSDLFLNNVLLHEVQIQYVYLMGYYVVPGSMRLYVQQYYRNILQEKPTKKSMKSQDDTIRTKTK